MISKKIILIGDFATGKTSLIHRYVDNQFSDTYLSTIGVKISRKNIVLKNETVQGLIWDIEGGTETKPVNTIYLKGAHGCIIVTDITREETIENIVTYLNTIEEVVPSVPIILVLNKCDKTEDIIANKILEQVKEQYREKVKNVYLGSAKSGKGVEELFYTLSQHMIDSKKD